jgi:hypothetical protein
MGPALEILPSVLTDGKQIDNKNRASAQLCLWAKARFGGLFMSVG